MTDPTIAGPTVPESSDGDLIVSLSEIEAMSKKAARGAGFSWGMAEEAGFAARWLATYRLPGPELLLAVLRTKPSPKQCPLTIGVRISDRARLLVDDGEAIRIDDAAFPVLTLPFLGQITKRFGCQLAFDDVMVTATGISEHGLNALAEQQRGSFIIKSASVQEAVELRPQSVSGYPIDWADWEGLDGFASRTYVPASEASRSAGAGVGLTDND